MELYGSAGLPPFRSVALLAFEHCIHRCQPFRCEMAFACPEVGQTLYEFGTDYAAWA